MCVRARVCVSEIIVFTLSSITIIKLIQIVPAFNNYTNA